MSDARTIKKLAAAIGMATRSAQFMVAGQLPSVDPGLNVKGLGRVTVPLKRGVAMSLIALSRQAPYGKGTETLVDTEVRKTFEIDSQNFRLGVEWNSTIADTMRTVADALGLPADRLEAHPYKLLIYEKGGFFLPHRDSEKLDRMVASMIVVLPNPFEGGRLIVRHGATTQKSRFEEAAAGTAANFAAFYADCEHEVESVTKGVRLAVAYNLVLKPAPTSDAVKPTARADVLAEAIGKWVTRRPSEPLVFALDHHYTERGLSLDLLKGADRELADQLIPSAEKADCLVHLAQVSRHLMQHADDGNYEYGYSRRYSRAPRPRAITIGETYEDELDGSEWTDLPGNKQPWGNIAFDLSAIVSSIPIDEWKPTSEEYEGYTGNAGNTIDRWYHRSAIVVWHRDHHYEIVAKAGVHDCMPLFCSMTKKLAKTPKKRIDEARRECIQFARALVNQWPRKYVRHWDYEPEVSSLEEFPKHLLMLHDRETVADFLMKLAEQDTVLSLKSFVLAVCQEFGWNAFSRELKQLITSRQDVRGRVDISPRDLDWLSEFCCDPSEDPDKSQLAGELCKLAADRFCEPYPTQSIYLRDVDREDSVAVKSLPVLLQALSASGRDEDLSRVIRFVRELPGRFSLDDCQVPALKALVPWSRQQLGKVHPQFQSWNDAVRDQLERSTAQKPTPPTDWKRPSDIHCKCQYCAQISRFLADPKQEVTRIPAREDNREHLINMIYRHQYDVKHSLERKGSPFSLVLQKTTGSFDRAVKRYEDDCRLLSELPLISNTLTASPISSPAKKRAKKR